MDHGFEDMVVQLAQPRGRNREVTQKDGTVKVSTRLGPVTYRPASDFAVQAVSRSLVKPVLTRQQPVSVSASVPLTEQQFHHRMETVCRELQLRGAHTVVKDADLISRWARLHALEGRLQEAVGRLGAAEQISGHLEQMNAYLQEERQRCQQLSSQLGREQQGSESRAVEVGRLAALAQQSTEEVMAAREAAQQERSRAEQLLHDKASPHKAKSTQACLAAAGVTVVQEWPSNSPDLNPIENCWSYMQHKVNLLHPTDIESLTQAITQAWAELPAEYLQSLVASVPKRLDLVVAKEGGYTGY